MPSKVKSDKKEKRSKKSSRSKKEKKEKKDKLVKEEQVVVEEPQVTESTVTPTTEKKSGRRTHTKESVLEEFDSLIGSLSEQLESLKGKKGHSLKYLKSLNKQLKSLKSHASKVMKTKRVVRNTSNSGFLKPVNISKEMTKFTGWNSGDKYSRVQVTKFICNYIKDHNLQNPADRRQIQADSKLKKLLKVDSSTPLTYYHLQTLLKPHFV